MRFLRRLFSDLSLLLATAACSETPSGSTVLHRDSAGITIVESKEPRWEPHEAWSVDSVPILDLTATSVGVAHEFFRVTHATRLDDGTIVVADRGSGEIRAFSPSGQWQWTAGRPGNGPGEFNRLSHVVQFHRDSLMAYDYWLGRVTILTPGGRVARVMAPFSQELRLRSVFPLSDSLLAGVVYPLEYLAGTTEGLYRVPQHLVRLTATDGALVDTVTGFPGFEGYMFHGGDMAPLFGKAGHVAVGQGKMVVGTSDAMEYRVYSLSGQLERIVRVPDYDLVLSIVELRAERAARLPDGMKAPPSYRDGVMALPDQNTRPAYADLLADSEGCVWAAEFLGAAEADEPTDWEVFSKQGEWLGTVRLPARFRVYEIGSDYVLGRWLSALDVEHVQMLGLRRTTGF
jgi:hypothetical protein